MQTNKPEFLNQKRVRPQKQRGEDCPQPNHSSPEKTRWKREEPEGEEREELGIHNGIDISECV